MNTRTMVHYLLLLATLCGLCFMIGSQSLAGTSMEADGQLLLEGPAKIVKGFPVILRVKVHGPQMVPKISLFDQTGEILIELLSKNSGKKWIILPATPDEALIMMTPDGQRIDGVGKGMFRVSLSKQESRAMIFDLSSLTPTLGKGTMLADIPPGDYSLRVEMPFSKTRSNAIDMEIIPPSDEERQFIKEVLSSGVSRRRDGVNWSKLLRDRISLPEGSLSKLRPDARRQLQFHVLLSRVSGAHVPSTNIAKSICVPKYLEAEKECFLLEVDIMTKGQEAENRKEAFLKEHPSLRWRFENTQSGAGSFLRYREKKKD